MRSQEHSQRVKFSSRFLRQFSKWWLDSGANISAELGAGLLFGAAGPQDSVIQSFRALPPSSSDSHNLQNYHLALEDLRLATETEPELSWLDALGWFCLRPQSAGELISVDVAFHNANFPDSGKLAVIFHSPTEDSIAAELYTNLPNSPLHREKHQRVSLRLSTSTNGAVPVIRPKMRDQAFLNAYQIAGALDRAQRWEEWKERIPWLRHFDGLRR